MFEITFPKIRNVRKDEPILHHQRNNTAIHNCLKRKITKKMVHEKDKPKIQNPLTLLQDAFSEYKGHLEPGDVDKIVAASGEKKRTVEKYLSGDISKTATGTKIFKAMRKLVLDREKEVKKLVA